MKRVLLLLAGCLSVGGISAQMAFSLGNHRVEPLKNARQVERKGLKVVNGIDAPVEGYYYLLVQLTTLPTAQARTELLEQGVQLLDYVGDNTYFARIAENFTHRRLRRLGVLSFVFPEWQWKVNAALANNEIPSYAKKGLRVGVVVSHFAGVSPEFAKGRMKAMGIPFDEGAYSEFFLSFTLWIPQQQALELARESWVQHVALVSPPSELFDRETELDRPLPREI